MKRIVIQFTVAFACFLIVACAWSQAKNKTDITGKWIVCVDTVLKKNYTCEKPYTAFEFLKDGSYNEFRQAADPKEPQAVQEFKGRWMIDKNVLTLNENDHPGRKSFPVVYNIVWVDDTHFYSESSEGELAQKLWIYFSRKK